MPRWFTNAARVRIALDDCAINERAEKAGVTIPDNYDMGPLADDVERWVWRAIEEKLNRAAEERDLNELVMSLLVRDIRANY